MSHRPATFSDASPRSTFGPRGELYALRAKDGRKLWSRGLEAHNLVAFERATGEVAWSVSHAELASYASPILGTLGGKRQIVVPAGVPWSSEIEPAPGELRLLQAFVNTVRDRSRTPTCR